MKVNSTIVLTLILLVLMLGAGLLSGAWGLVVGREALKGITQPDTRPANNLANRKNAPPKREEVMILREEEIITNVKARMGGDTTDRKPSATAVPVTKPTPSAAKSAFPLSTKSQGVVLEIASARQQGENLVLKVSLRNTGTQPVRFLYNLLNLEDNQGRPLNASSDGLPPELAPASEVYNGTISVPVSLLTKVESLSLELTDYPERRVQLKLMDIPVKLDAPAKN